MSFVNRMALESAGAVNGTGSIMIIVVYIAIFAVLYFIMIRPQRKEQKQKAQILSQLAVGDSVRTTGGFIGTVIDIDDESSTVIVEFGNNKNCRIPMVKEAIVEVEKPEDAVKDSSKDDKK
ncbi:MULTISPECIES: preprotein translocase subunit YajC [unclassified Butyrivibrio]|uniref:preprotein translocase subunit YajC n=1 Tax=unclassified Butyrivibrio TaxID=2639466 RepID=UPI000409036A|nr:MULTISPECIES: preprotein translocase subunit YajC [unclassified Butyrivibrio]